jgi:hypothetical protein
LHNLTIFLLPKERVDFSEVTGGLRPDSVLEGTPPRRELKKRRPSLGKYEFCKALHPKSLYENSMFISLDRLNKRPVHR